MRKILIAVSVLGILLLSVMGAYAQREIKLGFDRSSDDDGQAVTEYRLYRSPVSGAYDMSVDKVIGTVTATGADSYTVRVALPDGFSFLIATAVGPTGESLPSNELRVFLREPETTEVVDPDLAPPPGIGIER